MIGDALTYLARLASVLILAGAVLVGGRVAWDALCDWCGISEEEAPVERPALRLVR